MLSSAPDRALCGRCEQLERKRGAIINIGSAAGAIPTGTRFSFALLLRRARSSLTRLHGAPSRNTGDPLYAVYSGTKAYVDFFSRSLNLEYKSKGVHVEVRARPARQCILTTLPVNPYSLPF